MMNIKITVNTLDLIKVDFIINNVTLIYNKSSIVFNTACKSSMSSTIAKERSLLWQLSSDVRFYDFGYEACLYADNKSDRQTDM